MAEKLYWLETYGCQMNKAESNSFELELQRSGWSAAEKPEEADLVILNTCSVRKTAEDRIWGRLGFFKALKARRPLTLTVVGCMAENYREELKGSSYGVDLVFGTLEKSSLVRTLDHLAETAGTDSFLVDAPHPEGTYRFSDLHRGENEFKAFVPVMHGCDNFCSYCIVPYVRGREISRDPESILEEISALEAQNVREVTLLGQNVNSYRYTTAGGKIIRFPDLLGMIEERVNSIEWVRFLTSHPKDLSGALIERIAGNPLFCRHIHLPVQHGSNRILSAMNRNYTREKYLSLIEALAAGLPGVSVTTDLLIGFPGETEEDLQDTLDLMSAVRFNDAFTYQYNPRAGTKAFDLGDSVPEEVKLERLSRVIELQRSIGQQKKRDRLGSRVKVLTEGISRKNGNELLARTERDEMVVFPGVPGSIGTFRIVELTALSGSTFKAKEIV